MHLITVVIGTRPEAIKLAPVAKILLKSNIFKVRVVLTGQHEEMVIKLMKLFDIPIDIKLNVMREGQSLSKLSSRILLELEKEYVENIPSLVIVQGDTTTAFCASLAAFYQNIKVAHVEAGLRTEDLFNPFPEEANRRIISQISSLHFAPTENAKKNLIKANVLGEIVETGNTVIDALFLIKNKVGNYKLNNFDKINQDLILLTVHRRENWGNNLENICKAIKSLINKNSDLIFLIPVHPNQIVKDVFFNILGNQKQVILTKPLDYQELISVLKTCKLILTDSGGIQEEAPSLGKPILVLRETTERPEGIDAGTAKLIGTDPDVIEKETLNILKNKKEYEKMSKKCNPYGDGKASERIFKAILNYLKLKKN